eukprot:10047399-Karenia_brevis.AAC.1
MEDAVFENAIFADAMTSGDRDSSLTGGVRCIETDVTTGLIVTKTADLEAGSEFMMAAPVCCMKSNNSFLTAAILIEFSDNVRMPIGFYLRGDRVLSLT